MTNAVTSQQRQPLPETWVRKLFAEMHGNYGSRWLSMWATGEKLADGSDAGVAVAMRVWAEKLAGFADKPEAIKAVLANLPETVPTLPKFLEACREQARKSGDVRPDQLTYTPSAEDLERQRVAAAKVAAAAREKTIGGDPTRWYMKPGSQLAIDTIFAEANKGNALFAAVREQHIQNGVCTDKGRLLKRWENGAYIQCGRPE